MRILRTVLSSGLILALCGAPVLAQTTYQLTDLGTLGGMRSYGQAINASGQVTGRAYTTNDAAYHAFLWDGTAMQDLGTLGGTYIEGSEGRAINASGQVTGYARTASNLTYHAFLWDGTAMQDLGTLGGTLSEGLAINASGQVTGGANTAAASRAFLWDGTAMQDLGAVGGTYSGGLAINASGQVTGYAYTPKNAERHAFLWDGTAMQDLGTLGGQDSEGRAINASGQVTGYAYTTPNDTVQHAFLWDGTAMQDLGTLGGTNSIGYDINNSGQVTGTADITNDAAYHAFLWDGMAMLDLGTLGETYSYGVAINASGQVTGHVYTPGNAPRRAFLWDGTAMQDLNALIDPSDPLQPYVTLIYGSDINDNGQIVAQGIDSRTGTEHAYLVSPAIVSDKTAPEVIITSPSNGATYLRNATVLANYTCEDELSGIATCQGDVVNGAAVPTSVLGPQSFTVSGTDLAGNAAVASIGYQVVDDVIDLSTSLLLSPFGAVSFGDVAVGASRVRRFRLQNMSKGVLPIASIVTYGPNRAMFKIAHDCGASLTGWANCTIVVTFRPSSPGAKSATLRLTTGNGLLRYRPLTGNGL